MSVYWFYCEGYASILGLLLIACHCHGFTVSSMLVCWFFGSMSVLWVYYEYHVSVLGLL